MSLPFLFLPCGQSFRCLLARLPELAAPPALRARALHYLPPLSEAGHYLPPLSEAGDFLRPVRPEIAPGEVTVGSAVDTLAAGRAYP